MVTHADVIPGMRIEMTGRVIKVRERRVAAMIAARDVRTIKGASPLGASLAHLRDEFRAQAMRIGGDSGALIPGIAIGDTSLQTTDFNTAMRSAGLSHLTAVSGANFAIVSSFLLWLLQWPIRTLRPRLIVTAAMLSIFILLVRPSPSVLRAAVMAAVVMVARSSGQRSVAASSLATAVATLLLIDPFQGFEPGFILSVLATAALIFLAPVIQERFEMVVPRWIAEALALPTAAAALCAPYILYLSGEISIATVLFNLLVAPVIAPLTILAFIAALLVIPIPSLSYFLLEIARPLASWIVVVASHHEAFPFLSMSPQLALLLVIALLSIYLIRRKLFVATLLLLTGVLAISTMQFPSRDWIVGQCDVGQGDALLINLGGKSAILFDAGPDPTLLDRCLRIFSIRKLPLVVISHMHADHYNGLSGIKNRYVGEIWVNDPSQKSALPTSVTSRPRLTVSQGRAGMSATIADARVSILWPDEYIANFDSIQGDGSLENNRSMVIRIDIGGTAILVTGDIEPQVQKLIAERFDLSDISILKVPHHGSKYQDDAFIEEASGRIALISVGKGNSYGHPNRSLISHLQKLSTRVMRTDIDGAIAISWRSEVGQSPSVFSAHRLRKEWWSIQWR